MSSSNIKSWADASSDEESDSEHPRIAPPPSGLPGSESYSALQQAEETEYYAADGDGGGGSVGGGNLRVMEDLPANPPFTAYVGNVHRDILHSKDFWAELDRMLEDRGCAVDVDGQLVPVKIVGTRLITDRNTGQTKGFGYVEFGTPEELLAFLNLGNHQLCGRNLKVDIASGEPRSGAGGGGGRGAGGGERRRSTHARGNRGEGGGGGRYDRQYSDNGNGNYNRRDNRDDTPIDGSQFQGGRYARSSSSVSIGSGAAGGGSGSLRRNGSGVMKRTDSAASAGGGGLAVPNSPAKQRPSLKLAPRTKPLEEGNQSASRSSIFGDAKPRDETKFEEKKAVVAATAAVTPIRDDTDVGSITASIGAMEIKEVSNENKEDANEKADASDSKEEDKTTNDKSVGKQEEFTFSSTKALDRKTSRGAASRGASGRGGDRNKDGEDRSNKKDGRRDSIGRRPFGRGEGRGGGGRGDRPRNTDRGGRNNTRDAGKRPSASAAKASNGDTTRDGVAVVSTTSLATAAAALPPKKDSKAPPKKANSFAAFMDESDDE